MAMGLGAAGPASAAVDFTPDDGGENDVDPSSLTQQTDLSAIGIDSTTGEIGWRWDEPTLSGGNTQTVCALYDDPLDPDGAPDYALCYQITGDPAAPHQIRTSPKRFRVIRTLTFR
jgi:hypothetical protein